MHALLAHSGPTPARMTATTAPVAPPSALQRLLETPRFQYFIITVIVINAITLGLETDPAFLARHEGLLHALDRIALAIFTVEIAMKLTVYRLRFFGDAWNVFDFVIVAVALVPASGKQ